jgi:hypothetical protein
LSTASCAAGLPAQLAWTAAHDGTPAGVGSLDALGDGLGLGVGLGLGEGEGDGCGVGVEDATSGPFGVHAPTAARQRRRTTPFLTGNSNERGREGVTGWATGAKAPKIPRRSRCGPDNRRSASDRKATARALRIAEDLRRFIGSIAVACSALPMLVVNIAPASAATSSPPTPAAVSAASPPLLAGQLPAGRLEFGVSNLDVSWMTGTGVPWRYRFQYLAGGVNTSGNWLTWQDPALPPGQFALDYMRGSTTAPADYIPVFTWYQLLQSLPSTGSSELARDYNNLNNAATMSSYYASFKVLMQKAHQYGGQVVVHVEPDFWGYMEQKAAGAGASAISAKVKSSGFAEAASYPDNLAGFAAELKHLRDAYAPNVVLAMHASMWSSSIDLASDTRSTISAPAEADKTAAFLISAGVKTWDALFNDVDDHNAAWWELASCASPPCVSQYYTHWWDPNNVKFPNFTRYLAWIAELHAKTAVPQVAWQVPMGNQHYLTMNNTCGHYQDNVAPYFIAHAPDLFGAGLIAVLFGGGNDCQTTNEDAEGDGITNNGGAPTTDLLGGCAACNTVTSTSADDDGGYLRTFVGNYYARLSTCASVSTIASPASPALPGTRVTVTASAAGCSHAEYEFWLLAPGAGSYTLAQAYSPTNTMSWDTTGGALGTYRVSVWVRDSTSAGLYGNTSGRWDAYSSSLTYTVGGGCASVSDSALPAAAAMRGATVTITAVAVGCANPLYEFWLLAPGASGYSLAQAYGTSGTLSWDTTAKPLGSFRVVVWVRDAAGSGTAGNASGRWDAYNSRLLYAVTAGCPSVDARSSRSGSITTVTASAPGCPSPQYEFWLLAPGTATYTLAQAYGSSNTFGFDTTGKAAGTYRVAVWVRDSSSGGVYGNAFGRWDAYNATITFATP